MPTDKNIAEVFTRPNTEARIHDLDQFTIWTDTPNRPGFRARLNFSERNGAPRISVWPNIEGVQGMWIGFDATTFTRFLDRLEEIAKGENGVSDKIENLGLNPATAGQRKGLPKPEDLIVRNTLHFGKSQSGMCWLAIEQAGVENIRFLLQCSMWHHFFKADGSKYTPEEGSSIHTLALIKTLRQAFTHWVGRARMPTERNPDQVPAGKSAGPAPSSISTFDDDVAF